MRDWVAKGGDGETDKLEKLWDEEVEEAENDITALGLSFLTVQSVKFWFCGTLANVEGEKEEEEAEQSPRRRKKSQEEIEEEEEKAEAAEAKARKLDQWIATFVMNMAWSFFYSTKWA